MLSAGELHTVISQVQGTPYKEVLTRYVDSDAFDTGNRNCFYDLGPHQEGKRYTPKGGARGIYIAEGVPTALGEATQKGLAALKPDRIATRLQMDMSVELKSVLNLGDARIRRRLQTSIEELKSPWKGGLLPPYSWSDTWLLGEAVFESERFDGIRFPSAKVNRHYCVLILTERMSKSSKLSAHRPGEGLVSLTGDFKLRP